MTSIGPQAYASNSAAAYARLAMTPPQTNAKKAAEEQAGEQGGGGSVNVTLSDAAKAAMNAGGDPASIEDVVSAARSAVDKLLADAKTKDAVTNGKGNIDLGGLDRRSLFAIASNQGGAFTEDEQALAIATMASNFEGAMAGPVAASRITGDHAAIYKAALAYLDKAGPEEKATPQWVEQRQAVLKGLQQTNANPGTLPSGIADDPVADYVASLGGEAPSPATRDILKVASDVRTALDAQYAKAEDGDALDLSPFDDRALAAIALDKGDQFSSDEVSAARDEIRRRASHNVTSGYGSNGGGSAGSLGADLITRYAGMSEEERQAQGWTPELYDQLLKSQQLSQKLAGMSGGGDASSYLGLGRPMSLLDYLT